jgi:hypothetical protein
MFLMDLSRVKCEEAWKKRPLFPEDIINADIRFHFGLLSFGPWTVDDGRLFIVCSSPSTV